jgi:hypothetical protein
MEKLLGAPAPSGIEKWKPAIRNGIIEIIEIILRRLTEKYPLK